MDDQSSNGDDGRVPLIAPPTTPTTAPIRPYSAFDFTRFQTTFNLLREFESSLENIEVYAALANIEAIRSEQIVEANELTGEAIQEALDLRRHKYEEAAADAGKERCPICLDEFVQDGSIVKLECQHMYHMDCIREWVERKNTCPICRQAAVPVV